jgi:hypothetical protein
MKLVATETEMLQLAYDVLTTGLPNFVGYGIELDYSQQEYDKAKQSLITSGSTKPNDICIEDVQREMLRMGYGLTFTDTEHEDDEPVTLTLELIKKNWDSIPFSRIEAVLKENYDADDADVIAQSMIYGEVVYG